MDTELIQKTKCSTSIKIILTISLLFNFMVIAGASFAFIKLKPVIDTFINPTTTAPDLGSIQLSNDSDIVFTPEEENIIRSIGIDPAKVPTNSEEVTPELANCLINAVGETRATEIEAGATPTTLEIIKASNCLK